MTLRKFPPWLLISRLLGTVALISALAVTLREPKGWLGATLIGAFLVLRVGAEWLFALSAPDPERRYRRSAIFNTLLALGVTAFWLYVRTTGPQ